MYDRLTTDDVDRYRALGVQVDLHTRFRPLRTRPDLVLTTHSRPADTGAPIVCLSSHARMTSHIEQSPVWMPHQMWSTHDTALWTVRQIARAYRGTRTPAVGSLVAVVGLGRVGRRVHRMLRRARCPVVAVHHDSLAAEGAMLAADVISLHLSDGPGWLDGIVPSLDGVAIVNGAWPGLLSRPALTEGLRYGAIREYIVDGGQDPDLPGVIWSPRTAYVGPHSDRQRPVVVERVIRAALAGNLASVARRVK
jgi:hypothetical protein